MYYQVVVILFISSSHRAYELHSVPWYLKCTFHIGTSTTTQLTDGVLTQMPSYLQLSLFTIAAAHVALL